MKVLVDRVKGYFYHLPGCYFMEEQKGHMFHDFDEIELEKAKIYYRPCPFCVKKENNDKDRLATRA